VGIVSLVFYEVGLTEDRDRAAREGVERESADRERTDRERRRDISDAERPSPAGGEHRGGRIRSLDRRRGQRRRLR
jgi:hypothetical protein